MERYLQLDSRDCGSSSLKRRRHTFSTSQLPTCVATAAAGVAGVAGTALALPGAADAGSAYMQSWSIRTRLCHSSATTAECLYPATERVDYAFLDPNNNSHRLCISFITDGSINDMCTANHVSSYARTIGGARDKSTFGRQYNSDRAFWADALVEW